MKKNKIIIIISLFICMFLSACKPNEILKEAFHTANEYRRQMQENNHGNTTPDLEEHTFEENYSYDAETHYKKATCEHSDLKAFEGKHKYGDNLICSICGFQKFKFKKDNGSGDVSYRIRVGEEVRPQVEYGGSLSDYKFTSSNSLVAIYSGGIIFPLNSGTTTISAYYDNVLESSIKVEVVSKEFIDSTPEYKNELKTLFESFNVYNNFSLKMYTIIDNKKEGIDMKYQASPLYYEYNILGKGLETGNELTIVQDENGKLYKYTDANASIIRRTYLESFSLDDVYMPSNSFYNDVDSIFDFSKAAVEKFDDNHYKFKMYLKDFGMDIISLANIDGDKQELLNDTIVEFDIKRQDKKLSIKFTATFIKNVGYDVIYTPITFNYEYDFNDVNKYDLSHFNYYPAASIKDAALTDLDEDIKIDSVKGSHFRYHLEKGAYLFLNISSVSSAKIHYTAYDADFNEINLRQNLDIDAICQDAVYVDVEGDYCFTVYPDNSNNSNISARLVKANYKQRNIKAFRADSDTIASGADYVEYTYENNSKTILKLKNTGNPPIIIYIANGISDSNYKDVIVFSELYIVPDIGINYYYIYNPEDYPYTYSFSIEEIPVPDTSSNTNIISEEYNEYYSIGLYGNVDLHLTLNIENDGIYKFTRNGLFGLEDCKVSINSDNAHTNNNSTYILKAGQYDILITDEEHKFDYFQVKCEYLHEIDYSTNISLGVFNTGSNLSSIRQVNEKISNDQIIKYYFTLNNAVDIIYASDQVEIYDSNDNKVSIHYTYPVAYCMHIIHLKSGTYYAMCKYENTSYEFIIGIMRKAASPYQAYDTTEIELDTLYKGELIWQYDAQYYKFVPDTDMNVCFDFYTTNIGNVMIFSDEDENVKQDYVNHKYSLKAGNTYYFAVLGYGKFLSFYNNNYYQFTLSIQE